MVEHAVIEIDCLEAVRLINGTEECLADEGLLVDKVRMLLSSLICKVYISHVHVLPRVANRAAHVVAGFVALGSWPG